MTALMVNTTAWTFSAFFAFLLLRDFIRISCGTDLSGEDSKGENAK
ncbi:MAG: hypothetical protein IJM42_00150 [Synergistes sp.]|nr:hypothetical protein [Synergistes sp.]